MALKDLTIESLTSYVEACRELHYAMEILRLDGYDLLVVPSRGAEPFISGAWKYAVQSWQSRHHSFVIGSYNDRPRPIERLYLPFTADAGDSVTTMTTSSIRCYWSRVLASIIRGEVDSIDYKLYQFTRALSGSLAIGSSTVRKRDNEKFIFVDTVVSGRAICEIIDAFHECHLVDCRFILLVDQNGAAIKNEYLAKIRALEAEQKVELIYVESIFTEDQGPAMSGIWTVNFPTLIDAARRMVPTFSESNAVGSALYYFEVSRRKNNTNVSITKSNAILSSLLFAALNEDSDIDVTSYFLDEFVKHVADNDLQDQRVTKKIAGNLIAQNVKFVKDIDVSSSHVLRASFDISDAERLMRSFIDGSWQPNATDR